MNLFASAVLSGLAVGVTYGLLAFSIVFLYRTTGVLNFAQGAMATFAAFVIFRLAVHRGLPLGVALLIGAAVMLALGVLIYLVVMRVNDDADFLNLVVRTLAVHLLLLAIVQRFWTEGEPFAFPSIFPQGQVEIFGMYLGKATLGAVAISAALAVAFGLFLSKTRLGLMFLALAEQGEVARLLGVNIRAMTAIAWAGAALIALVVGFTTAPTTLLSGEMMDLYLLSGIVAAIIGGLTSLYGSFAGGVIVGVVGNVTSVYAGHDVSLGVLFLLLIGVLLMRPGGIFGVNVTERI